jgi:hypothetical protein
VTISESFVDSSGLGESLPAPGTSAGLRTGTAVRAGRSVLTLLGGAAGFAIAWSNPDRELDQWYAWAGLGTFLGLVAGSSFGSGIARHLDVNAVQKVRSTLVLPAVAFFLITAAAALPLAVIVVGSAVTWRGLAFAGLAIVGGLPAGAALAAIRAVALRGLTGSPGRQLSGLIKLRRLLGRLLAILGSLVVLVVLVNAAGLNWGSTGTVPASAVFFAGAAATLLVGAMYIPTAALLRRRSAAFIDEHFPIDGVDRSALVAAAEERARLEAILGLDRTTLGELQAGLLIVSPLLASAGFSLLPF